MGAGKSTLGVQVAERIGRSFVDLDREIELGAGATVPEIFERRGEAAFRELEEVAALELLAANRPAVVALGGGAVKSQAIRAALGEHALTVHVEVDPAVAWRRVGGHGRPLAQDEGSFRALYEERQPLYREAADAVAHTVDELVLAAAGVHVGLGVLERLGELLPGEGPVALVADAHVAGIHGMDAQLALGSRLQTTHEVQVKTVDDLDRLWRSFRLERSATVVAFGGGTTTDLAGFAAATYMRGIDWVPVPTTLVGQVDAAIGGKTAIDLPEGKNLVGAFHWPARTIVDPALLATLPDAERLNGMAEVVKTGLLAGEPFWELADEELVRRCAAYKSALCLRDPHDHGPRHALNLGHTFGHALEAASGYELPHGRAVAVGLLAALRLSGRDTAPVEEVLAPRPVRVDRDRAWEALLRDKKGRLKIVLLGDDGPFEQELPEADVRAALDELISE
ncbi:MAG TPA: bifunctional shikimate kinase/3-dehydroquinate synthase [Gaiellaceae bacterium]|jgi:3-dehydroquinate synthetase